MKQINFQKTQFAKTHKRRNRSSEQDYIKEIESIINPQKKKAAHPEGFTGKFQQTFKEEILLILYNLFQRIEAGNTFSLTLQDSLIQILKPSKDIAGKKRNYNPISLV